VIFHTAVGRTAVAFADHPNVVSCPKPTAAHALVQRLQEIIAARGATSR